MTYHLKSVIAMNKVKKQSRATMHYEIWIASLIARNDEFGSCVKYNDPTHQH